MEDDKKYIVHDPSKGKVYYMTEDEYSARRDRIFQTPGVEVGVRRDIGADDEIDDKGVYYIDDSARGKRYTMTGEEYRARRDKIHANPAASVFTLDVDDYYGEQLADINRQIEEQERRTSTAKAQRNLGFLSPTPGAGAIRPINEKGARDEQRYEEEQRTLDELRKAQWENPRYQEELKALGAAADKGKERVDALSEQIKDTGDYKAWVRYRSSTALVGDSDFADKDKAETELLKTPGYKRDMEALDAANYLYEDAKKELEKPSRYDGNAVLNFLTGVGGNIGKVLTLLSLDKEKRVSLPVMEAVRTIHEHEGEHANIIDLVSDPNKLSYLSDAQKEMLSALVDYTVSSQYRAGNTSLSYNAGAGAIESAGYMLDFVIGGKGAGAATKGLTKGLMRAVAKGAMRAGLKGATRKAALAVPKFAIGSFTSAAKSVLSTPLMPSSYTNFLSQMRQINDVGEVDLSGEALLNAAADVLIENFSEYAGTQVEGLLGLPLKAAGKAGSWLGGNTIGRMIGKTRWEAWADLISKAKSTSVLKDAAFNGFLGEWGEEWYGNAVRVMTGVDKDALKDFATAEQQLTVLGSFAPMSLFGGVTSGARYRRAQKRMDAAGQALEAVLKKANYTQETINNILSVTKAENPTELAQSLAPVIQQVAKDNGDVSEVYKAVCDYAYAVAQYRTLDGVRDADATPLREAMQQDLSIIFGGDNWIMRKAIPLEGEDSQEETELRLVNTLTDKDGNELVVEAQGEDGTVAAVDMEGKRHYVSSGLINIPGKTDAQEAASKQYILSSLSLRDYLDQRLAARNVNAEALRMREEAAANQQALQQRVASEGVDFGPKEARQHGTLISADANGVQLQVAGQDAPVSMTWEQVAQEMNMPLNPQTDAELEEQELSRIDKMRSLNKSVPEGADLIVPIDGESEPAVYKFIRAELSEGEVIIKATDSEGNEVDLAPEQVSNLGGYLSVAPAETENPAAPQMQDAPADVFDDPVANEIGIDPKYMTKTGDGRRIVNKKALWEGDPEKWAEYNDRNGSGISTIEYVKNKLDKINTTVAAAEAKLKQALLDDAPDDMEQALRSVLSDAQGRQRRIQALYDGYVAAEEQARKTAEAEAKARRDAEDAKKQKEFQQQIEERKAEQARREERQQVILSQDEAFRANTEAFLAAKKYIGRATRLNAGEQSYKAHYVIMEATVPVTSHDPFNGFQPTEGFPVDENGRSLNTRDYQREKEEMDGARRIAEKPDYRLLEYMPGLTAEGVTATGNKRCTARKMAAQMGTDTELVNLYREYAEEYGFTPEQVDEFEHPIIVKVIDESVPYTAKFFDSFNRSIGTAASTVATAAKIGKMTDDALILRVATLLRDFTDIKDAYQSATTMNSLFALLEKEGLVPREDRPRYLDSEGRLTGGGEDFVESLLFGTIFSESDNAIRSAMQDASIRRAVAFAFPTLVRLRSLSGDYSLMPELTDAVRLLVEAKAANDGKREGAVADYMNQFTILAEGLPIEKATVQMLANVLNENKYGSLRRVLDMYINRAENADSGELLMTFGDSDGVGSVETKEAITKDILESLGLNTTVYDNSEQQQPEPADAQIHDASPEQGGGGVLFDGTGETSAEPAAAEGSDTSGQEPGTEVTQEIEAARSQVDTNPTEAQKKAGNYRKGHITIDGYDISIENPKGSVRSGTDASGSKWEVTMNNDYGYIRMTEGVDGDHIDVFLSDNPTEGNIFVVDQVNPDNGEFDEHKVMYGFPSEEEARAAYLANYSPGWKGLGNITEVSREEFKKWVESSHRKTKPFAEYKSVKTVAPAKSTVQGLEKYSEEEIKDLVYGHTLDVALEGKERFVLKKITLIGSRTKGTAKEGSDLDVLLEYEGSMKEDEVFNALNGEPLYIDGIRVDINPIRKEQSGTTEDWLKRQKAQQAQEDALAFIGTTREQALLDVLQGELNDISRRMREHPEQRESLLDEKAAVIQNYCEQSQTDPTAKIVSTTLSRLEDAMRNEAFSEDFISKTISKIAEALNDGAYPRAFRVGDGRLFMLADFLGDAQVVSSTFTHEEEHNITAQKHDDVALAGIGNKEAFLAAIDKWKGRIEHYHRLSDVGVANEFISHALEMYEHATDTQIDKAFKELGINDEKIINFVKNRINERRNRKRQLLSGDRGRGRTDTLRHGSTKEDSGENGRNSEAGTGDRLDGQRLRPAAQSQRGAESGRGAVEDRNRYEPSFVRDLSPAERARIEDIDRDGIPNPEVVDNLDEASEGTVLFSLEKGKKSLVGLHNISLEKLNKAIRLGGLANPSCAVIDLNYQNHFEYGEITFVMPSDLVGKRAGRNAGTWVRDAWTPTFPKITFHETEESQKRLAEMLKGLPKDLRSLIDRKVYDYINGDTYHSGLEYMFLKERGMEPAIQTNPRKYPHASEKEFFGKYLKRPEMSWSKTHGSDIMDAYESLSPEDRKMANMYVLRDGDMTKVQHALEMEEKWPHLKEVHEEPLSYASVDSFLYKIMRDERDAGQENLSLTVQRAIDAVSEQNLADEFNVWQENTINNLGYEQKIFQGYTDNGRRYKKATLENISKEMKKEGSAGAQSNSGLSFGSIMASMAKKLNTLSEIRSERGRLVPKGEYDKAREELMEKAKEYFFLFYDSKIAEKDGLYTAELVAADYVRDFFIKGMDIDKVVENYNKEQKKHLTLTDKEKQAINNFRQELKDAPTDMFETKFERPVYLNEFAAAVVPDNLPLTVRRVLEENGLTLFDYTGDERSDSRRQAVKAAAASRDDILFSFIGKKGAEAMDIEDKSRERRDNLEVARQMEAEGKTPASIKWATGWERGKDDLWRYEILDFTRLDLFGDVMYDKRNPDHVRYKELVRKINAAALMPDQFAPLSTEEMDEYNGLYGKYSAGVHRDMLDYGFLEDFLEADDLFKAYPQLRRYILRFDDSLPDNVGGYAEKRAIVLNMKHRFQYERLCDNLAHEIQHEIQDIEGFSVGTSLSAAEKKARVLNRLPKQTLTAAEIDYLYLGEYYYNSHSPEYKKSVSIEQYMADRASDGMFDAHKEFYEENVKGKTSDELRKLYNSILIKSKKRNILSSWDVYKRTSGEVEARNVARRRLFTSEQRRNPAEDTEDVSREDQILNMPANSLLDWLDDEEQTMFSMVNNNQRMFISNAEAAAKRVKMEKATPEQWLKMLEKEGGMKASEDKWLGLSDWLKESDKKTITKQEVLDFINENKIQIEEVPYYDLDYADIPAMRRLQEEYESIVVDDPEVMWAEADERLRDFYLDMQEKYGDDYIYNMNQSELTAEQGLIAERNRWSAENAPSVEDAAFDAMVEKYGDDFGLAFGQEGGNLFVNDSLAAEDFLGVKPINETRGSYTTEGLENKREIALTVPTIEPYNESDEVHFGDAGEGRAVAWVRFGETTTKTPASTLEHEAALRKERFIQEMFRKYNLAGQQLYEALTPEEQSKWESLERDYVNTRFGAPKPKKVLVIDEIQSKRHQEGREIGYQSEDLGTGGELLDMMQRYGVSRPIDLKDAIDEAERQAVNSISSLYNSFQIRFPDGWAKEEEYERNGFKNVRLVPDPSIVSEEDADWYNKMCQKRDEARADGETVAKWERSAEGVPPAPFEKNWHELAFKRMLRLAAEEGYDYVAWTTGDQQAERYNLSKVVDLIYRDNDYADGYRRFGLDSSNGQTITLKVDNDGNILGSKNADFAGKKLSEVVGKDMAVKMMALEEDDDIKGDDLRIGGEGMKGFYDDILPRFVNKYGKKWGVKVEDIELPIGATGESTMHSIPVNDQMKADVMDGQPMFSMVRDTELPYEGRLFDDNLNPVTFASMGVLPKGDINTSLVERVFTKSGGFAFNGKNKIESVADVAFLFRQLESSAIEQSFIVFVKDGVPTIVHVGMGGDAQTYIDEAPLVVGMKDFAPDKVYMVHNHPSGQVSPSAADIKSLNALQLIASNMGGKSVDVQGVIIDTFSGAYGVFDGEDVHAGIREQGGQADTASYDVLSFDTKVFSNEYKERSGLKINGAEDVASYLSAYRLGEGSKINALLLDGSQHITGCLVLNVNDLTSKNIKEQAKQITYAATKSAARNVILNGDFPIEARLISSLNNLLKTLSAGKVALIDVVKIDGKHALSLAEGTLNDSAIESHSEDTPLFSLVTDKAELERLESEPTITLYRAMQKVGPGEYIPPKSQKIPNSPEEKGKRLKAREPQKDGLWYRSDENPELAYEKDGKYYFDLKTANKNLGDVNGVLYNPYFHLSSWPLNDQFSAAYKSDGFVVVACEVPISELSGKYKAEKANDSTGPKDWGSGPVTAQLGDGRQVVLSRYVKIIGEVSDREVADIIAPKIKEKDITVPANVVTPGLRKALEAHGVKISEPINDDIMFSLSRSREDIISGAETEGWKGVMEKDDAQALRKEVFELLPLSTKEAVVDAALGSDFNLGASLNNYLMRLAEGGLENDETGMLRHLYNSIRDLSGNESLTDADCRYIVWKEGQGAVGDDLMALATQQAFKNRFGVGRDTQVRQFSMAKDFSEATDESREKADSAVEEASENLKIAREAAKASAKDGDLKAIVKAMTAQKTYDKATVASVVRFAKEILKGGKVKSLSRREIGRLLGLIANSTGKAPSYVAKYTDQLTDQLLDIIVSDEKEAFAEMLSIRDKVVNKQGVEAQGALDILGQTTLKAMKAFMTKSKADIQTRREELSDLLDSKDDAVRQRALAEMDGLDLAEQYIDTVGASESEAYGLEDDLDAYKDAKKIGAIDKKTHDQFVKSVRDALRENKLERVDDYRAMRIALKEMIKKSTDKTAAFREGEKQHADQIRHDASRDLEGESAKVIREETRLSRLVNNKTVRFFLKPLATFDQMLRTFAKHNITGEGYLYNRFMSGFLKAREEYITNRDSGYAELDAKASEVFGREMKWTDLYRLGKRLPALTVRMWDGSQMSDVPLPQPNLLYIYMANKMTDGKMKLRRAGISEEDVEVIKNFLEPRLVTLGDWLQDEFLPARRNRYNAVYESLFGAPMPAIENYFPLKIAEGDRQVEVDVTDGDVNNPLPSVITGSIIKRVRNSRMLDVANANVFDVAIEHLESMEDWAAYAHFRKDLNTLLSYRHFRNQVKNMSTVFGSGEQLWKNFIDVCKIAAGKYKSKGEHTQLLNVSKGATRARINFRPYTALKQLLSYPAFWVDASVDELWDGIHHPLVSWRWCMENLPLFRQRWEKRTIGDTRLMKTDSDWKVWEANLVKQASKSGMLPNAFIDAFTIAIGAKAVYETKYKKYISEGMSEELAAEKARQDATVVYNQSQQSDENAFISAIQLDRTLEAAALTTFRNASMGYQRRVHGAYRTLGRLLRGKGREDYISSAEEQYISEGMSSDAARTRAEREYRKAGIKAAGEIFIYQFFLNYLWKLGPLGALYALVFGGDDDKKKKKLSDPALATAITGFFEGLSMGGTVTDLVTNLVSGNKVRDWNFLGLPILQDIKNITASLASRGIDSQSIYDLVGLLAQGWCGVDPRLLSDTLVAVVDAAEGDMGLAKEIGFLLMRVAQAPQSQIKDFYMDEIQATAEEAGEMSAAELALRYVKYRKLRRDPLSAFREEDEKEQRKDYSETKKLVKEAMGMDK